MSRYLSIADHDKLPWRFHGRSAALCAKG